jgi:hypothetical protein
MTKKHFEALADALARIRPTSESEATFTQRLGAWSEVVSTVANVGQFHNPLFGREKFVRACNER